MTTKTVLITGSSGRIGSILVAALKEKYLVKTADLPLCDLRDWDVCHSLLKGAEIDVVIHLAWNTITENWRSQRIDPDNWRMAENIFLAARMHCVPRVILASSVHVHGYSDLRHLKNLPINPYLDCIPDSPYGVHKLGLEKLGQWNSTQGLEVICVRLGGVYRQDLRGNDCSMVGLSYPDLIKMIICCIEAEKVPGKFAVFYAVSANKNRIHGCDNDFGWIPSDDAQLFYYSKSTSGFRYPLISALTLAFKHFKSSIVALGRALVG